MPASSLTYYILRIAQRLSLITVIGATIAHWTILISFYVTNRYVGELENLKFTDSEQLNSDIERALHLQSLAVLRWVLLGATVTFLLLLVKRYRKYEKPMIIDSLTIIAFCLISVALSQMIARAFLARI